MNIICVSNTKYSPFVASEIMVAVLFCDPREVSPDHMNTGNLCYRNYQQVSDKLFDN